MLITERADFLLHQEYIKKIHVPDGCKGQKLVNQIVSECGRNWTFLDLSGQNLAKGNLRHVVDPNLQNVDLTRANCHKFQFNKANMRGVKAAKANFSGANFFGTDLANADLTGADMTSANVRDVHWQRTNLTGADLTGAKFGLSCPVGARYLQTVKHERVLPLHGPGGMECKVAVFAGEWPQDELIAFGERAVYLHNFEHEGLPDQYAGELAELWPHSPDELLHLAKEKIAEFRAKEATNDR